MRTSARLCCMLRMYSRITSTKSPPFCMTTFGGSLTNFTVLLPHSHDSSCYVSRPVLAPPPLWVQKHTDLRPYGFAHSPGMWHQPRFANFTCAWSCRLGGINPAINVRASFLRTFFFIIFQGISERFEQQCARPRDLSNGRRGASQLHRHVSVQLQIGS